MSFTTRQGRAFYKRPLAVLGATALAVGAFGPAAQAENHVQSIAPACEGWTDPFTFTDIQGETQAYQDAINCLAWYRVTEGRNPTTYAPDDDVKRYEMALFISNTISYIEESSDIDVVDPEDADDAGFEDIDGLTGEQQAVVAQLVELEIVEGKNADEFAPYESITRRDMARFIDRLVDNVVDGSEDADFYEADYTDLFVDVPQGLSGAEDIYSLRAEGIVQGESGNRYLPYDSVDRKDMAFFIMRTVADLVEKDYIDALQPEPVTNQSYTVTPQGETVRPISVVTGTNNEGRVTYMASVGSATDVNIMLVDASAVSTTGNQTRLSTSTPLATTEGVSIESVNGIAQTPAAATGNRTEVNGISPINGTVTFIVDSVNAHNVVPVVWSDTLATGSSDEFDRAADGTPREAFGVGGNTRWLPANAPSSATAAVGSVVFNDEANNRFALNTDDGYGADDDYSDADAMYTYDANDTFRTTAGGTAVSMADFKAQLNVGDSVEVVSYSTNPDAVSEFVIIVDTPTVPAVDAVQSGRNVVVNITPESPSSVSAYDSWVIQRASVSSAGTVGAYSTIATPTADADTDTAGFQYVDQAPAAGTYRYRAAGVIEGDQGGFSAYDQITVTAPAADTTAPAVFDQGPASAQSSTDTVLGSGDVLRFFFNEAMALGSSPTITLREDAAPERAVTINSSNATFALNSTAVGSVPAGYILSVTLTDTPTSGGTALRLSDLEAYGAAGIADANGNSWVPGEQAISLAPQLADDADVNASRVVNASTIRLVFNKPIDATTVELTEDFVLGGGGAATSVAVDGHVVTLSGSGFGASTTVSWDAGAFESTDGQEVEARAAATLD